MSQSRGPSRTRRRRRTSDVCRAGLPSKQREGRAQGIDACMLPKGIGPRYPGGNSACPCRVPHFGWHAQKSAVGSRRPARPTSPRQSVATLLRSASSSPDLVSSKSKWPWNRPLTQRREASFLGKIEGFSQFGVGAGSVRRFRSGEEPLRYRRGGSVRRSAGKPRRGTGAPPTTGGL